MNNELDVLIAISLLVTYFNASGEMKYVGEHVKEYLQGI